MVKRKNQYIEYDKGENVSSLSRCKKIKLRDCNIIDDFNKFHKNICVDEQIQRKTLKKIFKTLKENGENVGLRFWFILNHLDI